MTIPLVLLVSLLYFEMGSILLPYPLAGLGDLDVRVHIPVYVLESRLFLCL